MSLMALTLEALASKLRKTSTAKVHVSCSDIYFETFLKCTFVLSKRILCTFVRARFVYIFICTVKTGLCTFVL